MDNTGYRLSTEELETLEKYGGSDLYNVGTYFNQSSYRADVRIEDDHIMVVSVTMTREPLDDPFARATCVSCGRSATQTVSTHTASLHCSLYGWDDVSDSDLRDLQPTYVEGFSQETHATDEQVYVCTTCLDVTTTKLSAFVFNLLRIVQQEQVKTYSVRLDVAGSIYLSVTAKEEDIEDLVDEMVSTFNVEVNGDFGPDFDEVNENNTYIAHGTYEES